MAPLDLEEILKKHKAAKAEAAKPRFIPRGQRKKMEEEKKLKVEEEQKRQQEELQKTRSELQKAREELAGLQRVRRQEQSRSRESDHSVPTGPRAMRSYDDDGFNGNGNGSNSNRNNNNNQRDRQDASTKTNGSRTAEEVQEEKKYLERYTGPPAKVSTFSANKKRRRTTDQKFNFDWDPKDDTSQPWRYEETGAHERSANGATEQVRRKKATRDYNDPRLVPWQDKELSQMTTRDWRLFKVNLEIVTKGNNIPNPMRFWEESNLPHVLKDTIKQVGYTEPTPVQRAAIPIALQCRDLIGISKTGSGKTAAFVLPMLSYIEPLPPLNEVTKTEGPYALILAPTRELATQIQAEVIKFATRMGFTVVCLIGNKRTIEEDAFALRNGAEIIVATPGRLVDCLERHLLVLSQCSYVVLDEADRMVDGGFEDSIHKILAALPPSNGKPDDRDAEDPNIMSKFLTPNLRYRQTVMYSATMPPSVERIAKNYLKHPAMVTIGTIGEAVDTVEQQAMWVVSEDERRNKLRAMLNTYGTGKLVIVFVNTKSNCDAVAKDLKSSSFSAVTLHGNKTQDQREAALQSFRDGRTNVLVATDVAARGLDIPDVSLVINFNMAGTIEVYTHRIGRTGRAGKEGMAITFCGPEDHGVLYHLKQIMSKSQMSKVPPWLKDHPEAQSKPTF